MDMTIMQHINLLFMNEQMDNLGTRLDSRLTEVGKSKAGLARAINESPQTINNWVRRENIPSHKLLLVCKFLRCRPEWLLNGELPSEVSMVREQRGTDHFYRTESDWVREGLVPVISWEAAGSANWGESLAAEEPIPRIPCPVKHSDKTFALVMRDNSMTTSSSDSIPEGFYICVDPDQTKPEIGKLVLARINGQKAATCRQVADGGGTLFLKPLNPQYPPIFDGFEILGRVLFVGREP